jgi:hypothetical protein
VRNARQWGGCWLVCELYEQLKLDQFWAERLPPGRKGTRWDLILQTLCIYRFIEPGSEWRLHRYWYLFNAKFEILLYNLTSTYFECDPPIGETDKRKYGHSRETQIYPRKLAKLVHQTIVIKERATPQWANGCADNRQSRVQDGKVFK